MAGFPFMRQAETFLSSLPFILLLAVFILPCPMSAAAKPRPAIAFVHLLLPPGATVKALQSIGFETIASGDSYNDLGMI